ncbi:MAG: tyrosine--tRNA ligase [Acidimicrobiales bacterium]|nr:tyrosine--tRNA ligase [Acidimicrobiales bacterium]
MVAMTDPAAVIDDLEARGLVHDATDLDDLRRRLRQGPITLYYGCDPTADSLHVGNLLGLLVLRRFQDAGHRPVALAGGATGMVGDPSGRSEERNLLDEETLAANVSAIKGQIGRILDLSDRPGGATLVDNLDWTREIRLLDFLRDVAKHVTVNQMLARESVKARLQSEHGISFTEFSYMLLQAHDYLWLHEHLGVELQIGGSDQWGNMLGGVDLIRRIRGITAHALSWPLLTAPDGTKLGKTTGARIWLDPARTSPYRFYQHWMSTDDRQLPPFLAQFTLLPTPDVAAAVAEHEQAPERRSGQRLLAREVTTLVHGAEQAAAAEAASAILFGAPLADASEAALHQVAAEVPGLVVSRADLEAGLDLVELMATGGLLSASKGEARRTIDQGGVSVNGTVVAVGATLGTEDLLHGRWVLLRRGKKAYAMVEVAP